MSWLLLYLVSALFIAFIGRNRRPGFGGWLLLSLFLTPLIGLAIFLVTQTTFLPPVRAERVAYMPVGTSVGGTCSHCHRKLKRVEVEVCQSCSPHS
jgi:hypothetical protein